MGRRGPPPKPTKLKLITGNPGKRKINREEPQPAAVPPICPDWLDPVAQDKWKELVPELLRLGLLTVIDGDTLAAYCQAWAEFRMATIDLAKEGRTCKTSTGYLTPHPAVAQQRSAWAAIRAFASLFGLDPSSRSRLRGGGGDRDPEDNPFEAFLREKA